MLLKESLLAALKQCGELTLGRRIHSAISKLGYDERSSGLVRNLLVHMYGRCGRMVEAQLIFDAIPDPNVFCWTILMSAYAQNGSVKEATSVFWRMPVRDVVAWNAMIALEGHRNRSLQLFRLMNLDGIKWTETTLVSVIAACNSEHELGLVVAEEEEDRLVACSTVKVGNAMITAYSKCGNLARSNRIFEMIRARRDVVSWNAVIAAYVRNGRCKQALVTLRSMRLEGVRGDCITHVTALEACSELNEGKALHLEILGSCAVQSVDRVLGTALMTMYGRCGSPLVARSVFVGIQLHDVVSWTAMITAYVRNERHQSAVGLFRLMEVEGAVKPNQMTLSSVLDACSGLQDMCMGKCLVEEAVRNEELENLVIATAIVDMFSKCGELQSAKNIFDGITRLKNIVCWNAMIAGYALNGHDFEAVSLWKEMELQGTGADEATFVTILSCFSHSGQLTEALSCFVGVCEDHGLNRNADHYACVIDLLGRLGLLEEAEETVVNCCMEETSGALGWLTLLGACKTHDDVRRGARAASTVTEMSPGKAAPYLLLSNIHAVGEYE